MTRLRPRPAGATRANAAWSLPSGGGALPLDLRVKGRRLKKHPPLSLIIIDYLQLMKVRGRVESLEVDTAEPSRSLKQSSRSLSSPSSPSSDSTDA